MEYLMGLKIKKQPFNSVWICADSQEELGNTFMRFQEYYESPRFKEQVFTVGQVRSWYSKTYGADTYHLDWTGYNFPSFVLKPFREGLFDPLTNEEKILLDLVRYRHDSFYIIGAQDDATLRHELSHALYSYSVKYKISIDQLCKKNLKDLKKVSKYILDKGYDKSVLNDELQAYITDNDNKFIKENMPKSIIDQFNQLYDYHSKQN
jgi:hypothetical protein